jgi:hypothetical protein
MNSEVERYHDEHLKRVIYPKAAKRWEKALKDKEISHKEVFPYVKLAADKVFKEEFKPIQPMVNIKAIRILNQQLLGVAWQKDEAKEIEAETSKH